MVNFVRETSSSWTALSQSTALHALILAMTFASGMRVADLGAGSTQPMFLQVQEDRGSATGPSSSIRSRIPSRATTQEESLVIARSSTPNSASEVSADSLSSESKAPATASVSVGRGTETDHYLSLLLREIARHRRYPRLALMRGLQGTVLLDFSVSADGRIENVELRQSSQHEILDQAALRLLRDLNPVGSPPDAFSAPVRLTLPIVYDLRQASTT
jgi:TonB family protein